MAVLPHESASVSVAWTLSRGRVARNDTMREDDTLPGQTGLGQTLPGQTGLGQAAPARRARPDGTRPDGARTDRRGRVRGRRGAGRRRARLPAGGAGAVGGDRGPGGAAADGAPGLRRARLRGRRRVPARPGGGRAVGRAAVPGRADPRHPGGGRQGRPAGVAAVPAFRRGRDRRRRVRLDGGGPQPAHGAQPAPARGGRAARVRARRRHGGAARGRRHGAGGGRPGDRVPPGGGGRRARKPAAPRGRDRGDAVPLRPDRHRLRDRPRAPPRRHGAGTFLPSGPFAQLPMAGDGRRPEPVGGGVDRAQPVRARHPRL